MWKCLRTGEAQTESRWWQAARVWVRAEFLRGEKSSARQDAEVVAAGAGQKKALLAPR
jgi:hypothetical protein